MLAIPLFSIQIEAAAEFWKDGGFENMEFKQLKDKFPNAQDAVKIKAIVLNALYGGGIIAIEKVAGCLETALAATHATGLELVEELVIAMKDVTGCEHYSFASKFVHFFVDPNVPILDQYAEYMVAKHLGAAISRNPERYLGFVENIEKIKELAGLTCNCDQLDAYLWVAGEYWCWKKNQKIEINMDLKRHFERLEEIPGSEPTLRRLLGIGSSAANA
jgi:hypothetical protein